MLKKTITYEDFNGETVTEDHYFHLSKADLVEMEMQHPGGMAAYLQRIVDSQDGKAIIAEMKELILSTYGKRSEDGKRFTKNQALREEFASSEAYSQLFLEVCTNADAAAAFVNGIVPAGLEREMAAVSAKRMSTPEERAARDQAISGPLHNESMAERPGSAADITKDDPQLTSSRNVFENAAVPTEADIVNTQEEIFPRVLTHAEAIAMDPQELRNGLASGRYVFS